MLEQVLKNQGLTNKETTLFSLLLELGEQPASVLARKALLSRSSCYATLEQLLKKGLISRVYKNGVSCFQGNDLSPLLDILQHRKTQEIKEIGLLKLNLQMRKSKTDSEPQRSAAHYFCGESGLVNLTNQILSPPGTVRRIYLSQNPFTAAILKNHLAGQIKAVKILSTGTQPNLPGAISKTIHGAFDLGIDLIISGDKIAMICFPENFGLLVESRLITNAFARVFDLIWKFGRAIS